MKQPNWIDHDHIRATLFLRSNGDTGVMDTVITPNDPQWQQMQSYLENTLGSRRPAAS